MPVSKSTVECLIKFGILQIFPSLSQVTKEYIPESFYS